MANLTIPDFSKARLVRQVRGDDEVYQISQATGYFNQGSLSNVAYGATMNVYGQFGDDLTQSDPGAGSPPDYYYYRLSYAPPGSSDDDFKFIDRNLSDTRRFILALDSDPITSDPITDCCMYYHW